MIRFLQLSDIHFLCREETEDEYSQMRIRLEEDLHHNIGEQQIQYILICGDIADKGKTEEYNRASKFIDNILQKIGNSENKHFVCVVPGNHDINREVYKKSMNIIRPILLDELDNNNNKFLEEVKHKEPDTIKIIYHPLDCFNEFAYKYLSIDDIAKTLSMDDIALNLNDKNLFWKQKLCLIGDYTINLIGLNSVLTSDENDSTCNGDGKHQLFLPFSAYNIPTYENEVNIVMMHHPLDWLLSNEDIKKTFDDRFKVQLFGHLHRQSSDCKNVIKIFSGALQPKHNKKDRDKYFPVYNIIDLDIKEDELMIKLNSHKWNGHNFIDYSEESKPYSVQLKPIKKWNSESIIEAEKDLEEVKTVPIYEIKYMFINSSKKRSIIDTFIPDFKYDPTKSEMANYILFLKKVEEKGLFKELLEKLK